MKHLLIFLIIALTFSCGRETIDPEIPASGLYEIQSNGVLSNKIEYDHGRVAKLSAYTVCGKAFSVLNFKYTDNQITSVRSGWRMFWPSWGDDCNTEKPFEYSDYNFRYDHNGRCIKASTSNVEAIYEYNGEQAKLTLAYKDGGQAQIRYLKFDNRGNLIEERYSESDSAGLKRYEYDNNPNPLKGLVASVTPNPFHYANNVVRAMDNSGEILWERKYTYDSKGRPLTCVESTGATLTYLYK